RCSTRASSSSGRSTSPRNLRPTPQCPRSPDDSQSTGFDYYSRSPHRRIPGRDLPEWKQAHNASHRQVRARVEHTFARMKTWKILRDCRLRGNGVAVAMAGVATLANLAHAR
ncbi:transposase, partial [Nocardia farcinica]|uniref:transposase n=1 Tax=Nocardia farcinica TaxID=37329 RepID=UPI00226BD571